jgi:hypothetical protein
MSNEITFEAFPKLSRLSREIVITEKIDGTNAAVIISDDGTAIGAQSRNQLITPEKDNHGFARWVQEHAEELKAFLGPGRHFGEWWGQGIGPRKGYGLKEKRFSLFNTHRFAAEGVVLPAFLHVVPVITKCEFDTAMIDATLACLANNGSLASPGFMDPEGVVIYHRASGAMFKKTLKGDEHKGNQPE